MGQISAPKHSPAWWLPDLVAALGPAVKDDDLDRWTWQDGDVGVFIDKLSLAWQTVAWSPRRSVTLRSHQRPTDFEVRTAVGLAGLFDVKRSDR